ncbi:DNA repair and recombination protein RadB [Nanoarchaeota archaeon]
MEFQKVNPGTEVMRNLLQGGYEKDVITTIYGPGGSGKTNFAILVTIEMIKKGKKVIFIDTEGSFSIERFKQLCPEYEKYIESIFFLKPTTFAEQQKVFEKLKILVNDNIGLIVLDTVAMLYRLELGRTDNFYAINKSLGQQLSYLSEIARKRSIPVLITNQVYADFENKNKVNMVGGDILKYSSKCLIELQSLHGSNRLAILRKHRSLPEKKVMFDIKEDGLYEKEKNII